MEKSISELLANSFINAKISAIERFLKFKFNDDESQMMYDVFLLEEMRKEHQQKLKLLGRIDDEKDN